MVFFKFILHTFVEITESVNLSFTKCGCFEATISPIFILSSLLEYLLISLCPWSFVHCLFSILSSLHSSYWVICINIFIEVLLCFSASLLWPGSNIISCLVSSFVMDDGYLRQQSSVMDGVEGLEARENEATSSVETTNYSRGMWVN